MLVTGQCAVGRSIGARGLVPLQRHVCFPLRQLRGALGFPNWTDRAHYLPLAEETPTAPACRRLWIASLSSFRWDPCRYHLHCHERPSPISTPRCAPCPPGSSRMQTFVIDYGRRRRCVVEESHGVAPTQGGMTGRRAAEWPPSTTWSVSDRMAKASSNAESEVLRKLGVDNLQSSGRFAPR